MKVLMYLLPFFLLSSAEAKESMVDCEQHKIYCKIKELRPGMTYKTAMELSNTIYINAKKYDGDPILAVAIGMQETKLRPKNRSQKVIQFITECFEEECTETWKIVRGVSDVCMFQFHVDTIINYDIDPVQLKNDLNYCVAWHFKLMQSKQKLCSELGNEAWTCYHSKTEHLRKVYFRMVSEHL